MGCEFPFVKVEVGENEKNYDNGFLYMFTKDFGGSFYEKDTELDDFYWHNECELERDDPLLIETIEELGINVASGDNAELKIVEIPDDVICWKIHGYDGMETVEECHRSWS